MISHSIITRASAGDTALKQIDTYYKDAKDDYYSKENQPSQWQGKLAQELGLNGVVDKENFIDLLAGKDPKDYRKQLRPDKFNRKEANTRLAIDLTFNAPKSISIESLVNNKSDVLKAHEEAVAKTLAIIEERAETRIKHNGISQVEKTGKLAIAKFRHETNRNLDPHLHTHAVIVNLTKRADGQYRALHNDEIIKHTKDFTKIYQGFLAKELKEKGYAIRVTKDGFELAHINDEQIKAFSSRSKEINAELESKGLTRETATTADKQNAALDTRQRKNEKDIVQARHKWRITANQIGITGYKAQPVIAVQATAGQGTLKQKSMNDFENVFNTGKDEKTNLFKAEYLLNDYQKQYQQVKNQERTEQGGSNSESRATAERGNHADSRDRAGAGLVDGRPTRAAHAGIHGTAGASTGTGAEASRTATVSTTAETRAKGQGDSERTGQTIGGIESQYSQLGENSYSGFGNSRTLYGYGIDQEKDFAGAFSQQIQQQHNPTGTENFSDSMRVMPSITMANLDTSSHMLLPANQEIQLFQSRTEYFIGLRGDSDRFRNDESGIKDDKEDLDDIMAMDYHMADNLRLKWQDTLEDIESSDINTNELYVQNVDDLKRYAVNHLTDKDHIIEHDTLKNILVEKGLGIIDYSQVDDIIEEMKNENLIIKTDAMYKLNGKIYTDYALKDHLGVYEQVDDKQFSNILERNGVEKLNSIYTTQRAINVDNNIINKLEQSKGIYNPTYNTEEANLKLDNTTLKKEQRQCAEMILTTNDSVVGIQGYAGTGKSFMVSKTKEILEEKGKELHIFAPYASQVKNLQKDGLDANTVAKFLLSKKMQEKLDENSVIVIDEAGVLNSKQMSQILNLREQIGCQLVLLGDKAQTKAVEAGTPFELMQKHGMTTGELKDIQRQKDEQLRESVIKSVQGDFKKSVELLKDLYQVEKKEDRHNAIVNKYMSFSENEREQTLIVSGSNADRRSINELIREQQGVKGKGIETTKLIQSDKSTEELSHAITYHKGDYVTFNKVNKKDGIEANKAYEVLGRDLKTNHLIVRGDDNQKISVKLTKAKQASSYTAEDMELSVGDKIRITKTDKEKGISTGDLFEIKSLSRDAGEAYAEDKNGMGYTFKVDEKHHIDHSHAMTVHAAQGLTYDNVICDFNTKSRTLSQETYYVGVSRARENAFIFTNSIEEMPDKISQTATKHNAIELFDNSLSNNLDSDEIIEKGKNINAQINEFTSEYASNPELAKLVIDSFESNAEFINQHEFSLQNKYESYQTLDNSYGLSKSFSENINDIENLIKSDEENHKNIFDTLNQYVQITEDEHSKMVKETVLYLEGNSDVDMDKVGKVLDTYIMNRIMDEYTSYTHTMEKEIIVDAEFDKPSNTLNPAQEYFEKFVEPQLDKLGLNFEKSTYSGTNENYFRADLTTGSNNAKSFYEASLTLNDDGGVQLSIGKYTDLEHEKRGKYEETLHIFNKEDVESGQINLGKKTFEVEVKRGHSATDGIEAMDETIISKTNHADIANRIFDDSDFATHLKGASLKKDGQELVNSKDRDNSMEMD